jgi:glutamyl-tRNA synthetase
MLRKSNAEVARDFQPLLEAEGIHDTPERVEQVVAMMKDRVDFVKELLPLCRFFFVAPATYDEKTVAKRWKADSAQRMTELADLLRGLQDFSLENQESAVMAWIEAQGFKTGDIMNAFRLALVGEGKGPHMFDISAFLGKEETLRRLQRAVEVLK